MKTLVIFSKVIKVSNVFNLTALFESETQNILRYPPYLLEKSMLLHALLFFLWEQEVIKEAKRLLKDSYSQQYVQKASSPINNLLQLWQIFNTSCYI